MCVNQVVPDETEQSNPIKLVENNNMIEQTKK